MFYSSDLLDIVHVLLSFRDGTITKGVLYVAALFESRMDNSRTEVSRIENVDNVKAQNNPSTGSGAMMTLLIVFFVFLLRDGK